MSRAKDRPRVAERLSDGELEALADRMGLDIAVRELETRDGGER